MPKKFDNLKFQTVTQGLVGKADVDPASNETYDDVVTAVETQSAQDAGFADAAAERLDVFSRTGQGVDVLRRKGEVPVNSPNVDVDLSLLPRTKKSLAEDQLEAMRAAFIASVP